MKRILIACLAVLLPLGASATGNKPKPPQTPQATATSASTSGAKASSQSRSKSVSAASARASQHQTAEGGSATASNEGVSLTASNVYRDRLQAPDLYAPPIYPSGPCNSGGSWGFVVPGGGVNAGKAKPDPKCDLREMIRVLTPLNPTLALKLACTDPDVAKAAGAAGCVLPESSNAELPAVPAPAPEPVQCVTPADLVEREKRILEKCVGK